MSKPRLTALPAALFLGGLGLSLYGAQALWNLPAYSELDIEHSVELNLAMDLRREPITNQGALSAQSIEQRRQLLASEIREEISKERREPLQTLLIGLVMLSFALLKTWLSLRLPQTNTRP